MMKQMLSSIWVQNVEENFKLMFFYNLFPFVISCLVAKETLIYLYVWWCYCSITMAKVTVNTMILMDYYCSI